VAKISTATITGILTVNFTHEKEPFNFYSFLYFPGFDRWCPKRGMTNIAIKEQMDGMRNEFNGTILF
jgi:hypothetical protein